VTSSSSSSNQQEQQQQWQHPLAGLPAAVAGHDAAAAINCFMSPNLASYFALADLAVVTL
jgi:hypothetical protein